MREGGAGMNFFDNPTWTCDICHHERPDAQISVHKVDLTPADLLPRGQVIRNVKFCNDNPACKEGAENWKR